MKKYLLGFVFFSLAAVSLSLADLSSAQVDRSTDRERSDVTAVSTTLVISQFQAGGVVAEDEFIEIHNVGATAIDLNGYRIVYRSSAGTTDVGPFATWTTSTILQPGQFYLVATTSYDGSVTPNLTWMTNIGSMAAGAGGLAIKNSAGTVIDAVGWGTATNAFFEGTRTGAPGNNNSQARKLGGCQDTDNNLNDFTNTVPSAPRNTATTANICGSDPTQLYASFSANPSTVVSTGTTLLTVTVVPATAPPSTGIQVTANLSQIGGSSLQNLVDDGTNGDETAGDNVYSYLATIPANTTAGIYNVTAVASDAQMRSVNMGLNITVTGIPEVDDPLLFGNPSNATHDINNPTNYLITKPQLSFSYHRDNRSPNWVAWRLDSSWIGGSGRSGSFAPDPALPSGWYAVTTSDYSGSGYDRGHMCPSGDRTRSETDNQATFYMTNIVPQIADNNQGPWLRLEEELRVLVGQGKEVYIFSGGQGNVGTIGNGVVVPKWTWKVVLIMQNGNNDLDRVGRRSRMFGVIMSNESIVRNTPWRNYRVTVDQVETLTGFDFFSNLDPKLQARLEARPDLQ